MLSTIEDVFLHSLSEYLACIQAVYIRACKYLGRSLTQAFSHRFVACIRSTWIVSGTTVLTTEGKNLLRVSGGPHSGSVPSPESEQRSPLYADTPPPQRANESRSRWTVRELVTGNPKVLTEPLRRGRAAIDSETLEGGRDGLKASAFHRGQMHEQTTSSALLITRS